MRQKRVGEGVWYCLKWPDHVRDARNGMEFAVWNLHPYITLLWTGPMMDNIWLSMVMWLWKESYIFSWIKKIAMSCTHASAASWHAHCPSTRWLHNARKWPATCSSYNNLFIFLPWVPATWCPLKQRPVLFWNLLQCLGEGVLFISRSAELV